MDGVAQLVHFASDAAFAVDRRLRVVAWNRNAEALFGYSTQAVIGRPCYEILRAVLPDGQLLCTPECPASICFGSNTPFSAKDCRFVGMDGSWVKASISTIAVPEAMQGDNPLAVIFIRPRQEDISSQALSGYLRVFTLGPFGLAFRDRAIPIWQWERKQAVTLLKHLVTSRGHGVHRERLIELLWPEVPEQRGRERLKTVVYSLRQGFRRAGVNIEVISTADETYRLSDESIWVDAEAFEACVSEGSNLFRRQRTDEALRCYREAEELYRGDYLEDDLYSDWSDGERERLLEIYLGAMEEMASLHAVQGNYAEAVRICRQAVGREPCREAVHRALMLYLWHQGRRDEALVQYRACAQLLSKELSVEPMAETQRLYGRILESAEPPNLI